MLQSVEQAFHRLDALINKAGTTASWKPKELESLSLEEWDRVFAVNVRGLFQVTRASLPLLRKGENPSIVNTASIVGLRPGPQPLPYAAAKAAVVNLTKTLAWNLGPEIRVNAVAPGPTDTPLLGFDTMTADQQALETANPMGRIGRPQEVAAAVVFLAGPGATFFTGQCLGANGGAAMN